MKLIFVALITKIRLREVKIMNQIDIKAYAHKHYQSIRYESIHGLRRLLIDLSLERYKLDKTSDKYLLLTEQIEMARNELENRTSHKYSSSKERS